MKTRVAIEIKLSQWFITPFRKIEGEKSVFQTTYKYYFLCFHLVIVKNK